MLTLVEILLHLGNQVELLINPPDGVSYLLIKYPATNATRGSHRCTEGRCEGIFIDLNA